MFKTAWKKKAKAETGGRDEGSGSKKRRPAEEVEALINLDSLPIIQQQSSVLFSHE